MAKRKSGRKKGTERAKYRRRRMAATGELTRIFRRKQRVRLKAKKK